MYSDIYLCYKTNIFKYECKKFNNYEEADKYFNETYRHNSNKNIESTMFPVCKFMPKFMKNIVIHNKLSKQFIKTEIIN
jgi:hypothetical protein